MKRLELKISRGLDPENGLEQSLERVPEYTSLQSKPIYSLSDPSRLLFDVLIDEEKERQQLGMCLLDLNPNHFEERFADTDVEVLVYARTSEIDFGYGGPGFPIADFEEVAAFTTVEKALAGYAPLEQELLDSGKVPTMVVNLNKRYGVDLGGGGPCSDLSHAAGLYQHLIGFEQELIDKTMKSFLEEEFGEIK
ncbi:hypothetical protein HOE37_04790 [Candidatus Woesearchaeota archaeon]|jgi:hypothetical protein|nr:hypothetical protein [Candidatus Woesearchaeota archaeon]MBT4469398.1 hypothetical protein [Candidatus Woesearchaeota archaeon]MBT6744207.1 hypothetical protein [Candidatus Woesearchaeota archaeon]